MERKICCEGKIWVSSVGAWHAWLARSAWKVLETVLHHQGCLYTKNGGRAETPDAQTLWFEESG